MTTPIDILFQQADMRCTLCGKPPGCTCWVPCRCGGLYERGGTCRNPEHEQAPTRKPLVTKDQRFRTASGRIVKLHPTMPCPVRYFDGKWRLYCFYETTGGNTGWLVFARLEALNGN